MNPELIREIIKKGFDENTSQSVIKIFLDTVILTNLYCKIEGITIEEKTEVIYNYLQSLAKEPEIKQLLNIVIADDTSSLDYVEYLKEKFNVVVHKIADVKNPKDIDLVLFTGGQDIDPILYIEEVGKYTRINKKRDNIEINTFDKFKKHCLLLGICRGSQLLTVLNGGKLIQHVNGHNKDHSIITRNGHTYQMTSSHHQMMYPFDLNEKAYELIAYSEYFQSNTYLNGNNEEVELSKDFLEPEIVYYKNGNSLCIQGHPEWGYCDKKTSGMCLNVIGKYLQNFKNDRKTINPIYSTSSTNTQDSWDNFLYDDKQHYEENEIYEYEEEDEEYVKHEEKFN